MACSRCSESHRLAKVTGVFICQVCHVQLAMMTVQPEDHSEEWPSWTWFPGFTWTTQCQDRWIAIWCIAMVVQVGRFDVSTAPMTMSRWFRAASRSYLIHQRRNTWPSEHALRSWTAPMPLTPSVIGNAPFTGMSMDMLAGGKESCWVSLLCLHCFQLEALTFHQITCLTQALHKNHAYCTSIVH